MKQRWKVDAPVSAGPLRVLILDDRPADAELTLLELQRAGYQVSADVVQNLEDFTARLRSCYYDLVLSDFTLGQWDGMDALSALRLLGKDLPFILVTGSLGEEQAVDCIKLGATDFVLKERMVRLPVAVRRALAERALRAEQALAQEALRKSEARLRRVLETNVVGVIVVKLDGLVLEANNAFLNLIGYSRQELEAQKIRWTELTPPEHLAMDLAAVERLRKGQSLSPWEKEYLRKDGTRVPVLISAAVLEGARDEAVAFILDISERRREQEALRQSEEKFAKAFGSSPTAISISTLKEGRYVDVNDSFLFMTGYQRSEIIGRTAAELGMWIHPETRVALVEALNLQGKVLDFDFLFRAKNGEERFGALSAEVIQVGGEPCLLANIRDDTERRRAQQALLESKRQYQSLVNTVDGIVWEADAETLRFTFVSQQAERLLGYSIEQWRDQPGFWECHIHPEDRQSAVEHCARAVAEKRDHAFEYRMMAADNRIVWLRDMVNVVEEDHKVGRLRGLMVDVTEQREMEQQLRQAQRMEAVGQLAGGVAHDFNNLLMVIRGYCELMLDRLEPGSTVRNQAEGVMQAAQRAITVTRQLLAFSRKQVLSPRVLDLNAVVGNIGKMLLRLIGEDVKLELVKAPDLGRVKADPGQIEQVIVNLAVNARDALPNGGKLTIETRNVELDNVYARHHISVQPGPYVLLAVTDNGTGMDEETCSRIFEPFFTTKEQGKGTGLGLATVYGIVKQSGGYIWVYSEVGQGTTFKVYLPRVPDAAESEAVAGARTKPALASETVLLVEDEEGVRKVVRGFLEARGYRVLEAADGPEALRLATGQSGPIHLLLTDMVMPSMNGPELAKRMLRERSGIKVLYMSGYTPRGAWQNQDLNLQAPFLEKPFSGETLGNKLREVLDASNASGAAQRD
ncbi:MAG: PAS domain S-box protein [Acidobacteria bacterium]|nr:PAS domain S-box protein [Acidobacteriota bacterium]